MILHIETSTKVCSVALSNQGVLVDVLESNSDQFIHGEALTTMIHELLKRNAIEMASLQAISTALGPGSYTGLRIGLATTKGLVFGLGLPFIGISSLESLIALAREKHPTVAIAAAFDARRNEVFLRVQHEMNVLVADRPEEINAAYVPPVQPLLWVGDANDKLRALLQLGEQYFDDEIVPSARGQVRLAFERYIAGVFEDIHSIKPNYTKAFYTTAHSG